MERVAGSSVLAAAYGKHCPKWDDPDLKAIFLAITELNIVLSPAASIINVLPFLDLIPGPMPWRTYARAFRELEDQIYNKLIGEAVGGQASGMNTWAAAFASKDKPEGNQGHLLKNLIAAGIDTTAISLQTFVLACIRYPEWITSAQKEIDMIVGPDRLPSFTDRPLLPYVDAVVHETLRWRPAVRFGLPHKATADDVIEYQEQAYFIPKGSVIFAVAWAIEHDQSKYEDHDRFLPERFLDDGGQLKSGYETSAFGFGRR
ncbi:hypothetical protein H0H92_011569, partial [Tricholoma furcatifolium]